MKREVHFLRQGGFSILELAVAMAIIVILTALMIPSYLKSMPTRRLKASAREIFNEFMRAKMMAVSKSTAHRVAFDLDNGVFYLQYCVDDEKNRFMASNCGLWQRVPKAPGSAEAEPEKTLEKGVSFVSVNGQMDGIVTEAFNVNGTAQGGNVIIKNERGEQWKVWVINTGNIRMGRL